jgi:acetyltransferase-like isoleucine patch superfamily enzyme
MPRRVLHAIGETWGLILGRLRARALAVRGATVGAKTNVGPRVRVTRPWCLSLGERCVLESDVYVKATDDAARISLGTHVFVGKGTELDISTALSVGSHSLIAPGCFITDHRDRISASSRIDEQGCDGAPVRIGDDTWLGAHAVVLPGVTIGDGAVVGAGAVVRHDVPSGVVAVGIPAAVVGARPRQESTGP